MFSSGTTFSILQAVILVDEAAAVCSFPTAGSERGGTDPRADLTGKREFVQKMRKRQAGKKQLSSVPCQAAGRWLGAWGQSRAPETGSWSWLLRSSRALALPRVGLQCCHLFSQVCRHVGFLDRCARAELGFKICFCTQCLLPFRKLGIFRVGCHAVISRWMLLAACSRKITKRGLHTEGVGCPAPPEPQTWP